MELRYLVRRLC